ncbi:hypothetical protein AOXY_G18031 [Acipenser oxyrinchus oxyrinchus]|uniref:Uncharacterized protein n=1 Tax=Acipenser oxyrinchus oxyrinchus TaxID=40147 RepID=A0AAD8D8C2_ACIOX|nr:hypothetical protein AOXY_G18031 [Acipenser oxyrinchus oxyrinchus]
MNSPVRNSSLLKLLFQRRDRFRDTGQNVCSASIRTRNDCECGSCAACGRVHRSTGPDDLSWMPAVDFDQHGVYFGDNDVPCMRSAFPFWVRLRLLSDSLLCGRSQGLRSHLSKLQERSWRSQTLLIFFFFIRASEKQPTLPPGGRQ